MKHFMDIERIKFESELIRSNTNAFEIGDLIQISEKIDGSNASIRYNPDTESLDCFSRKQELSFSNTLNGFWNYVQTLNPEKWINEDYIIFGEWCCKNKITYNKDWYGKWIVYDVYCVSSRSYLLQENVKEICHDLGLEYIHVLYEGPFISWDHCKSFCHSPVYGDTQEGIVVKNQTKLYTDECRMPTVLKIVNEEFSEVKTHREKVHDPAKDLAVEMAETIVTERRVEKMILKLRDEGILPNIIEPKDMKVVAQNLPKRVYEDCLKEEKEIVIAMGEYGGKLINSTAMKIAKEIILGKDV